MDPNRFDILSRALGAHGPRRRVLGLLAAVPVVGGLLGILSPEETEAAGRRKRRKKAHKHGKGRKRPNRKHKKKKPTCTPTTCAAQGKSCGRLPDGCGTTLDCGPCTCATGCDPNCQTCNPATGLCDDVANDPPCDDGDACTQADTCQGGVCVAGAPVVCTTPPGPCYQATGSCQPDGSCLYAFKPQGAACNDGDACTQPDACNGTGTCVAGASVTCPVLNQCYEQGVCNTSTGVCTTPKKADGASCNDGDACTTGETCQAGTCGGGTSICTTPPVCRTAIGVTCTGGTCTYLSVADGISCDTVPCGTCTSGACVGCTAPQTCGGGGTPGTCGCKPAGLSSTCSSPQECCSGFCQSVTGGHASCCLPEGAAIPGGCNVRTVELCCTGVCLVASGMCVNL